MKGISPYITFSGNCKDAMAFYQECLGGELSIQLVGDSPLGGSAVSPVRDMVLHAVLKYNDSFIVGTDLVGDHGLSRGNGTSLLVEFSSEREIRDVYEKLVINGRPTHPIQATFLGGLFGDLEDQFGQSWMLFYRG